MVPRPSSSGITYTRFELEQKYSRHSWFSGAWEGGVCKMGILVNAKFSSELLKLHQRAQQENLAAERRGDWHLYFQRSYSCGCKESATLTAMISISHSARLLPAQGLCRSAVTSFKIRRVGLSSHLLSFSHFFYKSSLNCFLNPFDVMSRTIGS